MSSRLEERKVVRMHLVFSMCYLHSGAQVKQFDLHLNDCERTSPMTCQNEHLSTGSFQTLSLPSLSSLAVHLSSLF